MFGLNHLFFVVVVVSILSYHSSIKNKNASTPAEITTAPKTASDQKTTICFFRLFSISSLLLCCLSISFTTSVSIVTLGLCCLFLLIFFFLELSQKWNWMSSFYVTHPSNLCTQCTSWTPFSPPFSFSFSHLFLFHYLVCVLDFVYSMLNNRNSSVKMTCIVWF